MNPNNVVNPGSVNVADQADGPVVVDQTVTATSPSTNSGPTSRGLDYADGELSVDQPVTVSPTMTAGRTVEGGLDSPVRPATISVTQNNVADQVYGAGSPINVFV